MIQEMIKAFMLIFIAEMGDKTQILAMAFATRFPVRKVLLGIGIGVFFNHGLAVLLGSYLSTVVPVNTIQMVAGLAFVGFALWTLKSEDEEEEEESKIKFGPTATVAFAFFLGELGDKTQLTAITLSADANYPYMILAGTVLGMIATGSLGIVVGKTLGDKIPELGIKFLAGSVFMFFGIQKLFQTVPDKYMKVQFVIPVLVILVSVVFYMVRNLLIKRKQGIQSEFMAKSKMLYDYYHHMEKDLENICMGSEYCNGCKGNNCVIGRAKEIIKKSMDEKYDEIEIDGSGVIEGREFNKEDVIDSLTDTLKLLERLGERESAKSVNMVRNQLELILFGEKISTFSNIEEYLNEAEKYNKEICSKIKDLYKK